jgi:hypothetical protein
MRNRIFVLLFSAWCGVPMGCASIKEYQKAHLNDSEMELAARKAQKFETSFQLYREGASGANGGKTGGGCGCN